MPAPEDARLCCDVMLGDLARLLRMGGYDVASASERGVEDDDAVRELARSEGRILLTRDEQLAAGTDDVRLLRGGDADAQLRELADAGFELSLDEPRRCGRCNGRLDRVPESESTPEYAPDPAATPVWRCRDCGQYFWRGSHWDDVRSRLP